MEVCTSSNKACLSDPTNFDLKDPSASGLKTCLKEFLSIEDAELTSCLEISSEKGQKSGSIVREDNRKHSGNRKSDDSASRKCFNNRVEFLAFDKSKPYVNGEGTEEEDEAVDFSGIKHCDEPINQVHSQPTPPKLVSAMKGSRENKGKKLSVSWAADVYDPIPTSVSHVPSNTNRKKRGKRGNNNNKKQKGNGGKSSSRKGKDKKQAQRNNDVGNTAGKLTKDIDKWNNDIVNRVTDPSFCGNSFLKESIGSSNLQLPVTVTEAK